MRFGGEGRSRQEDAETSSRPGWALPRQRPSPFFSQPRGSLVTQVRSCSEKRLEAEGEEIRQANGPSMIPRTYGGIAVGFDVEDLIKLLEWHNSLRVSGQDSSSGEQQNGGDIEHHRPSLSISTQSREGKAPKSMVLSSA